MRGPVAESSSHLVNVHENSFAIVELDQTGMSLPAPSTYAMSSARLKAFTVPTSVIAEVVFHCLYWEELTTVPSFKNLMQEFKQALR